MTTSNQITILGSGDTHGTPVAGTTQAACTDKNPKSRRYRFGILLRLGGTTILIDSNPDLKWQCLDNNLALKDVDHILITHHHSDHVNGLGEFFFRRARPTRMWYGDDTLNRKLIEYWEYLQRDGVLEFNSFTNFIPFQLTDAVQVTPIELNHGFPASGFVIKWQNKTIAIVTDTNARLSDRTLQLLRGVDLMFIDTFSENLEQVNGVYEDCGIATPDLSKEWYHMTLPEVKTIQKKVGAKRVYTIHMSRHMSPHAQLVKKYQTDNFIIGYDRLTIDL